MKKSLTEVFNKVKSRVGLPKSADIRVYDNTTGFPVSRKTQITTIGLDQYLRNFDNSTRVATFLHELERRVGARVGARLELWLAGQPVDGRRSIARLR